MRQFHGSSSTRDHYNTLSVPQNANKNQIKSSFYKLSKLYHPDVTADPGAKEKFQKVSEAYAVLGDDRRRRAYDRQLEASGSGLHRHPAPASAYPGYGTNTTGHWGHGHDPGARRRPGATHAWQRHNAPGTGPYWKGQPKSSPYTHPKAGPEFHQDPFNSPHVRKATGHNSNLSRHQHRFSAADRMNHVSSFWRAVQIIGVVMFVATIGGGLSASA
ncbi:DnaJ domain-containing protein [Irpex rosettiformis]|uniref:DnaJ domain-containing protein n=1 Tax=Irpex rosettiformis TaxID=378272 RepID=A0ACB8TP75_9APHY|nr:DnaJ domain-containing protein [Irpex rosettiformis]